MFSGQKKEFLLCLYFSIPVVNLRNLCVELMSRLLYLKVVSNLTASKIKLGKNFLTFHNFSSVLSRISVFS